MRKAYGKYGMLALLGVVLLGALLAAAPAALAQATFVTMTGTESWAADPNPPTVYRVSGGVVHMKFGNSFQVDWGVPGMPFSYNTTHVKAVAALVDGVPTDALISGTFEAVNALTGTWEGTFTGTMDMQAMTWSIEGRGKGVGGAAVGLLMHFTESGGGTSWPVTATILYPHGM